LKPKAGIEVTSEETAEKKAAQRVLAKLAVKVLINQARQSYEK
jgi:ethanolamine ammonia-lyase large subunit